MNTSELEMELLRSARGLPKETLKEIIALIHHLKRQNYPANPADSILAALQQLSRDQTNHLEEEVEKYQKLYPRE